MLSESNKSRGGEEFTHGIPKMKCQPNPGIEMLSFFIFFTLLILTFLHSRRSQHISNWNVICSDN